MIPLQIMKTVSERMIINYDLLKSKEIILHKYYYLIKILLNIKKPFY